MKCLETIQNYRDGFEILPSEIDAIENELKVVDAIQNKGITMIIKESEYFNNEHITIQIYKKHFSKEEWNSLKEVLL